MYEDDDYEPRKIVYIGQGSHYVRAMTKKSISIYCFKRRVIFGVPIACLDHSIDIEPGTYNDIYVADWFEGFGIPYKNPMDCIPTWLRRAGREELDIALKRMRKSLHKKRYKQLDFLA